MRMMGTESGVSFCMINRDSIQTLKACLESVAGVADEIIVVDTGSTDESPDLARTYGARVIFSTWTDDFSAARNIFFQVARFPWILSLDSDEVLGDVEKARLSKILRRFPMTAFQFNVRNYFFLREYERTISPDDLAGEVLPGVGVTLTHAIRLFPNLPTIRYSFPIHESPVPSLLRHNIAIRSLDIPIHHYGLLGGRQQIRSKWSSYKALGLKKISHFPGFYMGYFELGKLYLFENNLEAALKMFSTCVRLKPGFVQGHYQLALTLFKLERFDQCRRYAEQVLRHVPGNLNFVYLLGVLDNRSGRRQSAVKCFTSILRRKPFHQASYLHLADAYMNLGSYKEAEMILLKLVEKEPRREEPYMLLARMAELQGDYVRGCSFLREGLTRIPQSSELKLYLEILETLFKRMNTYESTGTSRATGGGSSCP